MPASYLQTLHAMAYNNAWANHRMLAACAFSHTKAPDGSRLVKGRSVTGFANSEEAAIGLTHVVPFLVEDMLKETGGIYSKAADWQPHVIVDGNLIIGQNPASAQGGGRAVLQGLAADAAPSKEHQQSTAAVADGVAHHRRGGSCRERPSLGTSGHPALVVA